MILTEEKIKEIWDSMPDGINGFLTSWGYVTFARKIMEAMSDIEQYQQLCAAAYQMAGVVGAPVRFLDALSDASNGEIGLRQDVEGLLPVDITEFHIDGTAQSEDPPRTASGGDMVVNADDLAFWESAFLRVLPSSMESNTWTVNGNSITTGEGKVQMAARWADFASKERRRRLHVVAA